MNSGYVTAVAAGESQRFYSGVGIFYWHYLSSPPQIDPTLPAVPPRMKGTDVPGVGAQAPWEGQLPSTMGQRCVYVAT
jgi:hypothetical protein